MRLWHRGFFLHSGVGVCTAALRLLARLGVQVNKFGASCDLLTERCRSGECTWAFFRIEGF